jgi:hypothetical protein
MAVRKFRSVADMPGPAPRTPLDPDNLRIAVALMELAHRLHPLRRTPGTRKFHSLDEALRARKE